MNPNLPADYTQGYRDLYDDHKELRNSREFSEKSIFLSKWKLIVGLCICLCLVNVQVHAQTDFAPGDIMFTGYDSDIPDAFSFVLLKDVVSGTVINITDRGWSNGTGFRVDNTTEGTIQLTFNAAYPCGTEILFTDTEDANDWDNPVNQSGAVVGTVVIVAGGDMDGPELSNNGDQLFIYQNPEPTAGNQDNFITAISMDQGSIDGILGPWNTSATTDDNSAKPSGLSDFQVVAFAWLTFLAELDNAKYDCSPNVGNVDFLRFSIANETSAGILLGTGSDNWALNDNYLTLSTYCNFCCLSTNLTGPDFVSTGQSFTIYIDGTLPPGQSWQIYTAGCGSGSPTLTMADSFNITAPGSEGNLIYYVRASGASECSGQCVPISVCVENTPDAPCTVCNANPEVCGDCLMPDVDPNPDLDSGCFEIKLIFILDESGSIGGNAEDVEQGVLAFLNSLNGQDIQMALIEFSSQARLVIDYTVINNALIQSMEGYFNGIPFGMGGQTYNPNGGTNWHDAMIKADALATSDVLMLFTDGVPTFWSASGQDCGNGATTQMPEIINPVKLANKFKSEGTHMFMLGVGGNIDSENLEFLSGPEEYDAGINTIGTSDYSIGNFVDLAEDLADFVSELCSTPLELDKQVLGAVCDGVQQFMFIIHNPGTESAATIIEVKDTFPSGYTNIMYNGSPFVKVCIEEACWPQGYLAPDNAFLWTTNSVPPGESDTLIISAEVLPTGIYTNIAWADGSNTLLISDTVTSPNFVDDLSPTILCPPNVTISCNDSTLPSATGVPTATDPDGTTPDLSYTDTIEGSPCEMIITRTWTATDGCQNSAVCIQDIVVNDTSPPELDCPDNISIDCAESTLPSNTGNATASDDCDHMLAINFSDVTMEGGCAQGYIIIRTWTTEDDCGNENSCTQVITLGDNQAPAITCPANVTIQCTASTLPSNTGSATATDFCSNITITSTDVIVPLGCPQNRIITRTWHATDACNNASTCNQIITIIDNVAPVITCPANVTISCTSSTLPATTGNPTATDNCSTFTFSFSNVIVAGSCPQEKTITRTWQVTDACGNSNSCVQTITVDDSSPPVITCPANITIACNASTLPSNTGTATAIDNCSTFIISSSDMMVGGSCPQEKTIIRTWSATDACGNAGTCNQIITVEDNISPVIICPVDVTIECDDSTAPGSTGLATATDNCDNAPVFIYNDVTAEGLCPQAYTITRTWTSSDACSNSSTCVQVISVKDFTPPVIVCPPNVTIECLDNTLPAENGSATATDNCDSEPDVTYSDVTISGPTPFGHTILRTWLVLDHCYNYSTCLQTIIVENPIVPSITGMATDTICSGDAVVFQAEDQGFGMTTYQWNFGSGSSPGTASGIGPHTVHYNYNATNGSIGANVILTVSIAGCLSASDTVANIHVNPIPNPAIMAPTSGLCYFRNRTFKPVAAEIPGFLYHWNFGSGASIPSITGYGPHMVSYSTTGIKTVQLIVVGNTPGASCSDTATISFNVVACPGSIRGKVRREDGTGIATVNVKLFTDVNLDGLPEGVAVRDLYTNHLSPIGNFLMTNLDPGQYVLVETQPAGYYSVSDGDDSNDFDTLVYSVPDDDIIPVTIEPQEIDSNNVFVERPSPGIINGHVFQDLDNDLNPDVGEGIDGITVGLWRDMDQNGIADPGGFLSNALTNAIGFYEFGDLIIGHYVIEQIQPDGYESAMDIDPSPDGDVVPNTNSNNNIIPVSITLNETDADNYFIEIQVCGTQVTNTNDVGPGSLRYVIDCVVDGSTITFHPFLQNQTIHLLSGRIAINKNLFIHCSLTPRVKVNSDVPGAFLINAGATVEFMNLDITSGLSGFSGAAIENYGHSILWDMNIFRNVLLLPGNYLIYNGTNGIITVKGGIQIDNN